MPDLRHRDYVFENARLETPNHGLFYGCTVSKNQSVGISLPSPCAFASSKIALPSAANRIPSPILLLKHVISLADCRPRSLPAITPFTSGAASQHASFPAPLAA